MVRLEKRTQCMSHIETQLLYLQILDSIGSQHILTFIIAVKQLLIMLTVGETFEKTAWFSVINYINLF